MTRPNWKARLACGAIVVAFVALQGMYSVADNVSWLLVVGRKMLGGAHLYADILEVNPPASVMLYFPAAWVEQRFGLRAEYVVLASTTALTVLMIAYSGRLMEKRGLAADPWRWAAAALVVFGVMAGRSFAEREHIAAVLVLPSLSLVAGRLKRTSAGSWSEGLIAGVAAGVAISIKPHFAAGLLLPQLYAAARLRSLKPLLGSENVFMVATFVLYVIVVFAAFGDFWTNMFPVLRDVYMQAKSSELLLISKVAASAALIALFFVLDRYRRGGEAYLTSTYLLSAAGFLIAYFVQGKPWPYHYYPAAAFGLLAALASLLSRSSAEAGADPLGRRIDLYCKSVAAGLLAINLVAFFPPPSLSESLKPSIARAAPHPRILAVSGELGISQPLTREVEGTWVGRFASQWITENVQGLLRDDPNMAPERRARLAAWAKLDADAFVEDLSRGDPDILLVDKRTQFVDWRAWLKGLGRSDLLCAYERIDGNLRVDLYARRPAADAEGECAFR